MFSPEQIKEAVGAVNARTSHSPTVGIVLGSGLSEFAATVADADIITAADIPHWPSSSVAGHHGRLIIGRLSGRTVLVLQGRSHFYEGHSIYDITLPVRVMHGLGIQTLIVTNAAGGIHPDLRQGDLMLIKDHINFPGLAGQNPLRGPNDDTLGPRFPDMTHSYDLALRALAQSVAQDAGFPLLEGVYTFVAGPTFETPAELRFIKGIGGDAVGMSTVPSVVVARHVGMRVLGISSITNVVHLDPAADDQTTHEEVMETGRQIIPKLEALLKGILQRLEG